jgi:hypothetical protein
MFSIIVLDLPQCLVKWTLFQRNLESSSFGLSWNSLDIWIGCFHVCFCFRLWCDIAVISLPGFPIRLVSPAAWSSLLHRTKKAMPMLNKWRTRRLGSQTPVQWWLSLAACVHWIHLGWSWMDRLHWRVISCVPIYIWLSYGHLYFVRPHCKLNFQLVWNYFALGDVQ